MEAEARKAAAAHGRQTGAVRVDLMFLMPTKDASRHGKPHTFVPDADNLAKLALDSIMRAGLIGDDSAVSSLNVSKTWAKSGALAAVIQPDQREQAAPPDPARPDWI